MSTLASNNHRQLEIYQTKQRRQSQKMGEGDGCRCGGDLGGGEISIGATILEISAWAGGP